jgi:hypothetical protein
MCIHKANGSVPSLHISSLRNKYGSSCLWNSLQVFWNQSSKISTYFCTWHHFLDFSFWLFFKALSQSSLSIAKRGSYAFLDQLFEFTLCVPHVYKQWTPIAHDVQSCHVVVNKLNLFLHCAFSIYPHTTTMSSTTCWLAYNSRPPYIFVFEFDAMIFSSTWELLFCCFRASLLPLQSFLLQK